MSRGVDLRAGARWRVVWLEFIVAHRSFPLIFNRVERGWRDAAGSIYSSDRAYAGTCKNDDRLSRVTDHRRALYYRNE